MRYATTGHGAVIPTTYNGQSFRSRTEARWAVFFDTLGLTWEYEPEGFQFADGTRYLPDFLVHRLDGNRPVYWEVKPLIWPIPDEWMTKGESLVKTVINSTVVLALGPINVGSIGHQRQDRLISALFSTSFNPRFGQARWNPVTVGWSYVNERYALALLEADWTVPDEIGGEINCWDSDVLRAAKRARTFEFWKDAA